jgi:SET family sugar efflux transporter-like MFS transporter
VGYLLLTATTSYPLMLLIGALFLGAGSAAFPQLFALSRSHTDGGAGASGGGIPVLRSAWSLAWAVGPLAGGALLSWQGFTGLLLATGLGFGLVIVAVLKVKAPPPASPGPDQEVRTARSGHMRPLVPAIVAFTLFHTAMFSGSVALPLYVTEELGRPAGEVGLMFSVCALVEIPAALGLMLLPPGVRKDRVILLGMGLFVLYFVLVVAATGVVALVLVQLARGVAIAVVGALGITYFQDQLPGAAGRSTTLFANTATAGSLVSGIAAGAVAQALGYRAALVACAVLSVLAWSLFFLARRRGQPLPL